MNLRFTAALLLVFSIMADAQDRMPPIPADKLTPAQKHSNELLAATPRGAVGAGGPFVPLLRSPELMDRLQAVGEYLRYKNSVPQKLVEMAIIMTARQSMQQYEWNAHYPLALKAGLPEGLAADEEIVYNFTAELLQNKSVSDATYGRMLAKFGEQGAVDTTGLVGYYSTLALILNMARSPAQAESTAPKLAPFPR
jgi:4-carboxymuconolactone decarboxylase